MPTFKFRSFYLCYNHFMTNLPKRVALILPGLVLLGGGFYMGALTSQHVGDSYSSFDYFDLMPYILFASVGFLYIICGIFNLKYNPKLMARSVLIVGLFLIIYFIGAIYGVANFSPYGTSNEVRSNLRGLIRYGGGILGLSSLLFGLAAFFSKRETESV